MSLFPCERWATAVAGFNKGDESPKCSINIGSYCFWRAQGVGARFHLCWWAEPGGKQGRDFSKRSVASFPGLRNKLELGQRGLCVQVVGLPTTLSCKGGTGVCRALPCCCPNHANHSPSTALKSSPSKKGRGALLAVKPLGPTAAFSASQIPSEREDTQYDLRGARSYPTLEDEGDCAVKLGAFVTGKMEGLLAKDTIPGGLQGGTGSNNSNAV